MGGLTSALAFAKAGFHNIEVYEHTPNLGFVGAGSYGLFDLERLHQSVDPFVKIQFAPNLIRCLVSIAPEVWREVEAEAVILSRTSVRRAHSTFIFIWRQLTLAGGVTDDELGCVELAHVKSQYGYHHTVGHRSSLANALYNGCKRERGIRFFFSTIVSNLRAFEGRPEFTATPRNGDYPFLVSADILLGCGGIKSAVRVRLLEQLGVTAQVEDSGQAAYRIMLKREEMARDPELLALLDADQVTRWIGERRHIIAYPVSSKTIYNISTVQPDVNFAAGPSTAYTTKGSKSAVMSVFADFCPKLQRMLQLVPEGDICE